MIKDVKTKNITQKDVDLKNIDSKSINIDTPRNYPIIEHTNNALLWPEKIKGGIDITDSFEVSSVPTNPNTSLDSVETLQKKGVIPKNKK